MSKIILVTFAILALCTTVYMVSFNEYETADYKVVTEDGSFEVRDYKPMLLVSTTMDGSEMRNDSAFGRLFRYISGSNEDRQKIAMTSPVFSTNSDSKFWMSFVVPKDVANEGAPKPMDERVKLEEMKGGKFAAYRYSGYSNYSKNEKAKQKLMEWVKEKGYKTKGEILSAGYDAPGTPARFRRNEVLIKLVK